MKQSILDKTDSMHGRSGLSERQKELMKERIDQTLRTIHNKMIDLFHIDFTYFNDIKIVDKSDILDWLTRKMENDFQTNLVAQEEAEWRRFYRFVLEKQIKDHFKKLAFYDQERDTLCLSEDVLEDGVQTAISVSVHELSEKMLSTIFSPILRKQSLILKEKFLQIGKVKNFEEIRQLFDEYMRLVSASVFKEGLCEAMSLCTLRSMKASETYVNSLEKELEKQHLKCIDLLFDLERIREDIGETETVAMGLDAASSAAKVDEVKKLVMTTTLRNSHIIKGASYCLGYSLAKAFIERYELKEVEAVLELCPPFKAEHFSNPHMYLQLLKSKNLLPLMTPRS